MIDQPRLVNLTVTDVRQHVYCPRIPYFTYSLSTHRPTTYKMEEGKLEHQRTEELEHRRSLRTYGLKEGERQFDLALYSSRLGLAGRLDMLVRTRWELVPVDFKNTYGPLGLNHKYQLSAYALLVEDQFGGTVRRAFVYFIPRREAEEVVITPAARRHVHRILAEIRESLAAERLPEGTRQLGRCRECEFLNYCNDRW